MTSQAAQSPSTTPDGARHGPLPLAVAIVCRNNEATIGRTLASVRGLTAEIVAVDSGSTDGTIALLEREGARVVRHEWLGHIRTKQMALELCEQPWILSLDSDESLTDDLRYALRDAIERQDHAVAGYEVNRKVWWAGAFLEHAWQPEWRLRLVRRGSAKWGGYDPHDALEPRPGAGRIERLRGDLRHDSFATMADHLAGQVAHARVAARSYKAMSRRASVLNLVVSPVGAWLKQMVLRSAWLDGWRGWAAASATAAATLMKHLILLEETRRKDPGA